jgi:hypothetical protein
VAEEVAPPVLTVVPNGSSVHNVSEVDSLARWLAEAAVERESDGVPLPVARVSGRGPVAVATRNRLYAETTEQLALLSGPRVPPIDANELIPEPSSVDGPQTVTVTVILPHQVPVLSDVHPPSGLTPTPAPADSRPARLDTLPEVVHSAETAAVDTAGLAEALAGHRTRPKAVEVLIGEITKALAVNRADPEAYQQALTALDLHGVVDAFLAKDVDPRLSAGVLFDVVDRGVTNSADPIEYAAKIADKMDVLEGQGLIDGILRGPGDLGDRRRVLSGRLAGREGQDYLDNRRFRSTDADRELFRAGYSGYGRSADLMRRAVEEGVIRRPAGAEEDLVSVAALANPEFFEPLDAALRSGDQAVLRRYESQIRVITSGMNRLPTYQGGVTRIIGLPNAAAAQAAAARYEPGTVVRENGFTIASIAQDLPGQIRFLINSRSGREVWRVSGTGEGEVVFPPGTRFKVVFRDARGDRWFIGLDEQVTEPHGEAELVAGTGPRPPENPAVRLFAKAMTLLDKTGVAGLLPGNVFAEAVRGIAQGWDGDDIGRTGTFEQRAEVTVGLLRRFRRRLTVVNLEWLATARVAEAVRRYVAMEKVAMAELDVDIAELDAMSKAEGVNKSDG